MAEQIRRAVQWDLNDDALPLHPDFYEFIHEDEDGNLFIENKDGLRWTVTLAPKD